MRNKICLSFVLFILTSILLMIIVTSFPDIDFTGGTPANASNQSNTDIFINYTVSDSNDVYSFIDFNNDLLLWMRMDDVNNSGNPWDKSSYSHNGSLVNNTFINESGKFGNASWFDGDNDYINIEGLSIDTNDSYSVSAWVYSIKTDIGDESSIVQGGVSVLFVDNDAGGDPQCSARINNGSNNKITEATPFNREEWHLCTATFNGSTKNLSVYRDGVIKKSGIIPNGGIQDNFRIGEKSSSDFNGSIDEVLVFNRTLNEDEVASLYNTTSAVYRNFTDLEQGNHTFISHVVNLSGDLNSTQKRTVTIEFCGNGSLDYDEECDDSNLINGDGCSSDCEIEMCGDGRVNLYAFNMIFGDDWPLFDPNRGRGESEFKSSLDNVFSMWNSTDMKYPISVIFHDNEFNVTFPETANLNQSVYNNLTDFISKIDNTARDYVFFDFHYGLMEDNPGLYSDNSFINNVALQLRWDVIEAENGVYNFTYIDNETAIWAGKGINVSLRFVPYGQSNGNDMTPSWVFETVPNITFERNEVNVTIPKVWHSNFTSVYEDYIKNISDRYDNDSRITSIFIGVGHIGYTTAQPSTEGGSAFVENGWTPEIWERYTKDTIDLFNNSFDNKKLIIGITYLYTRDYPYLKTKKSQHDNYNASMRRILNYAAVRNYSVMFRSIDEDLSLFQNRGVPTLVDYISEKHSEDCDGVNLGNADCETQDYPSGGNLTCKSGCLFNYSECSNMPDYNDSFDGNTTNFTSEANIENVSNPILERLGYGMINFTNNLINFSRLDLDEEVIIQDKLISINLSGYGMTRLNVHANLIFYNISFIEPRIKKDGIDCQANICNITTYANNSLQVNVTGFSTYTIVEGYYVSSGSGYRGRNAIGAINNCLTNWTCTKWSDCINNTQTRSCVKDNINCYNSTKPIEIKYCGEAYPLSSPNSTNQSEEIPYTQDTTIFIKLIIPGLIIILIIFITIFILRLKKSKKRKKPKRQLKRKK